MKCNFFLGFLALATMMSFSCSNDDDDGANDNNNSDIPQLVSITSNGTWSVSSYLDDGQDETYHYAGYSFNFNTDGTVTALSSSNTVNGTWSITNSSSSSSGPDFNLFFTSPPDFEELSDDWDIIVINGTTIELRDVSGGDGSVDNLTFIKI